MNLKLILILLTVYLIIPIYCHEKNLENLYGVGKRNLSKNIIQEWKFNDQLFFIVEKKYEILLNDYENEGKNITDCLQQSKIYTTQEMKNSSFNYINCQDKNEWAYDNFTNLIIQEFQTGLIFMSCSDNNDLPKYILRCLDENIKTIRDKIIIENYKKTVNLLDNYNKNLNNNCMIEMKIANNKTFFNMKKKINECFKKNKIVTPRQFEYPREAIHQINDSIVLVNDPIVNNFYKNQIKLLGAIEMKSWPIFQKAAGNATANYTNMNNLYLKKYNKNITCCSNNPEIYIKIAMEYAMFKSDACVEAQMVNFHNFVTSVLSERFVNENFNGCLVKSNRQSIFECIVKTNLHGSESVKFVYKVMEKQFEESKKSIFNKVHDCLYNVVNYFVQNIDHANMQYSKCLNIQKGLHDCIEQPYDDFKPKIQPPLGIENIVNDIISQSIADIYLKFDE